EAFDHYYRTSPEPVPDDWNRWQNAADDAVLALQRQGVAFEPLGHDLDAVFDIPKRVKPKPATAPPIQQPASQPPVDEPSTTGPPTALAPRGQMFVRLGNKSYPVASLEEASTKFR